VAIKKFENLFKDTLHCKRALREISILRQCSHPCVIKLLDIVVPGDKNSFTEMYLVLEYAESDLRKLYKSGINLSMVHIKTITYNLLLALKYLHKCKVIHRDIKPANILLNEDCSVKLCDYGLSRSINGVDHQNLDLILGAISESRTPIIGNIKSKNLG
jgi:mitogen-activated protein kinase 1/3